MKRSIILVVLACAVSPSVFAQELRISADRRAIDFGTVQTGTTKTLGFDIINRGDDALTLTCSGGSVPGPFSASNDCFAAALSTDEACSYEYDFTPGTAGVFDTEANVVCNGLPISVEIAARSEAPRLGGGVRRVNFGQVDIGDPVGSFFAVSISNFGRSPVAMSCTNDSIGHPAFNVSVSNCNGSLIAPGGSCAYEIRFAPSSPGAVSTTFAPVCLGIEIPFALEGVGVSGAPTQTLYAEIRDLNFGPILVNELPGFIPNFVSRVTNRGPSQTVICTGGGVASPFTNTNECNNVVLGDTGQCFLRYTAFSTIPGMFSDTSVYTCNGEVFDITLSANAVLPALRFDASLLQFDSVSTDRSFVFADVFLVNEGFNAVTLDCTTPSESPPFVSSNFCTGERLLPGDSCQFTYAFFPPSAGNFADVSTLTCNGVPLQLELRATAVAPPPLFVDGFEQVPTLP